MTCGALSEQSRGAETIQWQRKSSRVGGPQLPLKPLCAMVLVSVGCSVQGRTLGTCYLLHLSLLLSMWVTDRLNLKVAWCASTGWISQLLLGGLSITTVITVHFTLVS